MRRSSGFTLIEILVVIAIIGMLSAVVTVYALRGSQTSRDAKRQADLKLLQAAVESYKVDNGRYPAGCNGADSWSGETGTDFECLTSDKRYITGLAPKYIRTLPRDPNRGSCKDTTGKNCGYAYVTNAEGSVYKIIAMNTVESEVVTPAHLLKSCDYIGGSADPRTSGFCGSLPNASYNAAEVTSAHVCHMDNDRFRYSYGVWGGFASLRAVDKDASDTVDDCASNDWCIDGNPNDLTADPLDTFIYRGSSITPPSLTASTKNTIRVRALNETTEVICK